MKKYGFLNLSKYDQARYVEKYQDGLIGWQGEGPKELAS